VTELIHTTSTTSAPLPDKMRYAQALAGSNLLPKQYREQPANLLFALEYADALGVSPIHAITSIHVIEGKPSASADLIASLVRRAGHRLRITGDDTYAEATILRADDPDFPFTARWDMARARQAGLAGKAVWKQYPAAMLRSRAITEVARQAAPDALFGVVYTPEELGAEVDDTGELVHTVTQVPAPASAPVSERSGVARLREAHPDPAAPPADDVHDAEVVDEGPAPATTEQRKAVIAALDADGVDGTNKQAVLDALTERLGRPITSTSELTADEADQITGAGQ